MTETTLALTYHDPPGRMYEQLVQVFPVVRDIFGSIVVEASDVSDGRSLDLLRDMGAHVFVADASGGLALLGRARRMVMRRALDHHAPTIMYCDADRVLHWAMVYPGELRAVVAQIGLYDFTVLGRTPRAFQSHPRIQKDTEAIINHVFATISGKPLDVTAAARGCSRRAAERLIMSATDDSVGVDATWPLWAQQQNDFVLGYIETDGLEFETADRFEAEVRAAGGVEQWKATLDADPALWTERLELARLEVAAISTFVGMSSS